MAMMLMYHEQEMVGDRSQRLSVVMQRWKGAVPSVGPLSVLSEKEEQLLGRVSAQQWRSRALLTTHVFPELRNGHRFATAHSDPQGNT